MEYYNGNRTPLERIDDSFLAELLERDGIPCRNRNISHDRPGSNCGCNNADIDFRSERQEQAHSCRCNEEHTCEQPERDFFKLPHLSGYPLAMVYSPFQEFEDIYDCDVALTRGTIFKKLDFPFYGSSCDCARQDRNSR